MSGFTQGTAGGSTALVLNSPNFFLTTNITGSRDSNNVNASVASLIGMTFVMNQGQSTANTFTGSVGIQGSNDTVSWFDVQRTAVVVGPGASVVSGTYGTSNPAVFLDYRFDIAFTAGSGCSLTGSVVLKG